MSTAPEVRWRRPRELGAVVQAARRKAALVVAPDELIVAVLLGDRDAVDLALLVGEGTRPRRRGRGREAVPA